MPQECCMDWSALLHVYSLSKGFCWPSCVNIHLEERIPAEYALPAFLVGAQVQATPCEVHR